MGSGFPAPQQDDASQGCQSPGRGRVLLLEWLCWEQGGLGGAEPLGTIRPWQGRTELCQLWGRSLTHFPLGLPTPPAPHQASGSAAAPFQMLRWSKVRPLP